MSKHKLVPVEPTEAMIKAAEEAYMPFGDMELALRMAILAAPAVQGEPVFMWHRGATDDESEVVDVDCACPCCVPLYTAPQPAEQQPDLTHLVDALTTTREMIAAALRANAPDYFTTDADIARHVAIQPLDTALSVFRKGGSTDGE